MIYLLVILIFLFFALRQIEHLLTYHPRPYAPGSRWTPPANVEEVWISVKHGQRIHGWFIPARRNAARGTLLYCHGNGGDLTDVAWVAEEFARRGFDAMVFDYRGYGRSDGKITDEWALYADAEAAFDYLIRERRMMPQRAVIYGQSLGSTAAIDLASRRACAALIVESGLSSAGDMGAAALPWLPRWFHFLAKNRFDSARKIAQVNCPVFVSHGTADPVIPVEQGRRLYAAASEPKRLLIIDGGDHNLVGSGNGYLDSVDRFIEESIAGR